MEHEERLRWRSRLWGNDFFQSNPRLRVAVLFLLVPVPGLSVGGGASGPYDCTAQSQIPEVECQALVALYEVTEGPGWRRSTGWLTNTTPCGWPGVTCANGAVTKLHLGLNELTGPIPPELGNLSSLGRLILYKNQLTGSIPPELGNLSNLMDLTLPENELSGPIPPELGNLPKLLILLLPENELSGPIPPELGDLSKLLILELSSNQLSGPIPPELGGLSNLSSLGLSSNRLSGLVPLEVAQRGGQIQDTSGADLCVFTPRGNDGLKMPDTQVYRNADLDGDGFICGLGFTAGLTTSTVAAQDYREMKGSYGLAGRRWR